MVIHHDSCANQIIYDKRTLLLYLFSNPTQITLHAADDLEFTATKMIL